MVPATLITLEKPEYRKQNKNLIPFFTILTELWR